MKEYVEYIVEGKPEDNGTWRFISEVFDNIHDVRERISQEKKIDGLYNGLYNSKKWQYRIKFRKVKVSEWEVL